VRLLCVCLVLATGRSLVQGVLPIVHTSKKKKKKKENLETVRVRYKKNGYKNINTPPTQWLRVEDISFKYVKIINIYICKT
jgi:hypothetical protein